MAERIIKWRSLDKAEWRTEEEADKRNDLIALVDAIMSRLTAYPKNASSKRDGYVQQSPSSLRDVKAMLVDATEPYLSSWYEDQKSKHGIGRQEMIDKVHPSWFERMLDGSGCPLSRAWRRLQCIDGQCREWCQPYFANNPDEGKQVDIGSLATAGGAK